MAFTGSAASAADTGGTGHTVTARHADAAHADGAKRAGLKATHAPVGSSDRSTRHRSSAKQSTAKHSTGTRSTARHGTGTHSTARPSRARHAAAHRAAGPHATGRPGTGRAMRALTWATASKIVADQTSPKAAHGTRPAQDRLTPAGTSGPQTWLPITPARYENARTIVRQALAKHMGVRAAVVAVATSMQESGLLNIDYGTSDSVGLFQQRPSCGWGTSAQILHPAYAADAFLSALRGYEARNPGWAQQPLWESAQGVQASGFPYAYAKWEAQAAHLVATITPHLV